MTDFTESNWAKTEFSRDYLDKADIYIAERRKMLGILGSFVRHFLSSKEDKRILDLGCGDGIVTHGLLKADPALSATLIDGSQDMLDKASERLTGFANVRYFRASFQDLLATDIFDTKFDLVASSMAIHHLTLEEKKMLFGRIYSWLSSGGYFVNIDVVLAPTASIEEWYLKLWRQWMDEKKASIGLEAEPSDKIIRRYKTLEENKPDSLEDQLNALREAGFAEVDCFYKYGIFSIYGGAKKCMVL